MCLAGLRTLKEAAGKWERLPRPMTHPPRVHPQQSLHVPMAAPTMSPGFPPASDTNAAPTDEEAAEEKESHRDVCIVSRRLTT